jgi:hypothetical protein
MSDSPRDQRTYEPQSPRELEQEFPGWTVDRGTSQLWYARGPAILSGEDLLDLRDQLIRHRWIETARRLVTESREQS